MTRCRFHLVRDFGILLGLSLIGLILFVTLAYIPEQDSIIHGKCYVNRCDYIHDVCHQKCENGKCVTTSPYDCSYYRINCTYTYDGQNTTLNVLSPDDCSKGYKIVYHVGNDLPTIGEINVSKGYIVGITLLTINSFIFLILFIMAFYLFNYIEKLERVCFSLCLKVIIFWNDHQFKCSCPPWQRKRPVIIKELTYEPPPYRETNYDKIDI